VRLDEFLPEYDVSEHHEVVVDAPPEQTFKAIRELDLAKDPLVAALFFVRTIPHRITGKLPPTRRLTIEEMLQGGFRLLDDDSPRELIVGAIGRFWQLDSGIREIDAKRFVEFSEPGFAKAVMNFAVEPQGPGSSLVSTETRVLCTDDGARRKFLLYWKIVGPFSALIRNRMLRMIARSLRGVRGE
jgi:hypothetical protein